MKRVYIEYLNGDYEILEPERWSRFEVNDGILIIYKDGEIIALYNFSQLTKVEVREVS